MEAMLKHAQDVLRMEAEAILELVPRVDENFAAAVKLICISILQLIYSF